LSTKNNSRTI